MLLATPASASKTFSEFGTPTPNSVPAGITLGPDGNIWYTECANGAVGNLTPGKPPSFGTEFPVGGCPVSITSGPDHNLWFTDEEGSSTSAIGRITTAGTVTMFQLPSGDVFWNEDANGVDQITTGPDDNLWFTASHNDDAGSTAYVGRMTTDGTMTLFSVPADDADAVAITAGPDNNLWFTLDDSNDDLGQITTSGSITLFPGDGNGNASFGGITSWDGELWLADGSAVRRIATNGTGGNVPLPAGSKANGALAPGSCTDTLWYTGGDESDSSVFHNNDIGVIDHLFNPTALNTPSTNSEPLSITPATGGADWFTESQSSLSQLGRVVDSLGVIGCVPFLPGGVLLAGNVKGTLGGTIGWLMLDPGTHGVVDSSGMNLFGFTPAGGPAPLTMGSSATFAFNWSGDYPYDDPFDNTTSGQVNVPLSVQHVAGKPSKAKVIWATAAPPSGYGVDVQVKVPGATQYVTWQSGVTNESAKFGPSSPLWAGPGTYKFEARLRLLSNNAASGFSKAAISLG
jgi:virginiamycin B lyase